MKIIKFDDFKSCLIILLIILIKIFWKLFMSRKWLYMYSTKSSISSVLSFEITTNSQNRPSRRFCSVIFSVFPLQEEVRKVWKMTIRVHQPCTPNFSLETVILRMQANLLPEVVDTYTKVNVYKTNTRHSLVSSESKISKVSAAWDTMIC